MLTVACETIPWSEAATALVAAVVAAAGTLAAKHRAPSERTRASDLDPLAGYRGPLFDDPAAIAGDLQPVEPLTTWPLERSRVRRAMSELRRRG